MGFELVGYNLTSLDVLKYHERGGGNPPLLNLLSFRFIWACIWLQDRRSMSYFRRQILR